MSLTEGVVAVEAVAITEVSEKLLAVVVAIVVTGVGVVEAEAVTEAAAAIISNYAKYYLLLCLEMFDFKLSHLKYSEQLHVTLN